MFEYGRRIQLLEQPRGGYRQPLRPIGTTHLASIDSLKGPWGSRRSAFYLFGRKQIKQREGHVAQCSPQSNQPN